MILAICALADVSKYLDILTWEFWIILMHLPFWPEYNRILHLLLVLHNPAIWRWYPWSLLLSFEMLKILVQWMLRKNLNRLLQYHLGVRLCQYTFEIEAPTPNFEMTNIHRRKSIFSSLISCFSDHFFLVSDLRQLSCWYFLKFFQFFLHCCLCIWFF